MTPTLTLLLPAQAVATNWNLRAIDIVITILLTLLIGLSSWALKTVLAHAAKFERVDGGIAKINQQLWGVDGQNGHASDIRQINRSFRRIEHFLQRLDWRVQRLEERTGIPSGEHDKFDGSDDPEDDRRG
jgi:hypothetical protein